MKKAEWKRSLGITRGRKENDTKMGFLESVKEWTGLT